MDGTMCHGILHTPLSFLEACPRSVTKTQLACWMMTGFWPRHVIFWADVRNLPLSITGRGLSAGDINFRQLHLAGLWRVEFWPPEGRARAATGVGPGKSAGSLWKFKGIQGTVRGGYIQ
ncbi:hypothetical protein H1C71_039954 [Ictidomys tridecemlineatus]|nr:hypothetical protein H1C71_039954 [Ictidomys tridecemlineatus]